MFTSREEIKSKIDEMILRNKARREKLSDEVCITEYKESVENGIWSKAFQKALNEHEIIRIPKSEQPYIIDSQLVIPSNRHIIAEDGVIVRQAEGVRVLMMRNEHTHDGTHAPIDMSDMDCNITISGGRWEESWTCRLGYGRTGKYDEERSFYGVSTFMFFNNIEGLTLENMTFAHTAGFSVQTGNANDMIFENIRFERCYADGLHINGNTENVYIHDVRGQVGDDLVALNTYDWLNSSVNFGPGKTIWCEDLELSEDSTYKAFRLQPALYKYDDGSIVDCALYDVVIKNVKGILTYKMYMQTPPYRLGAQQPEWSGIGSMDNIYFEDIFIDLVHPLDMMRMYRESHPVRGTFAGFEIGANTGLIHFKNIDINLYPEQWPMTYAVCIGPKSSLENYGEGPCEVFDPYISSSADKLVLENFKVNGVKIESAEKYVKQISFDNINNDGMSSGTGTFKEIIVK